MKRNWDTVRELLRMLEALPDTDSSLQLSDFEEQDAYEYSYHAELLIEAGLVVGQMSRTLGQGPTHFFLQRLTWSGHEFLDTIRPDTVWEKTKGTFSENGISMTFDLVKSVATEISAAWLRGAIGI